MDERERLAAFIRRAKACQDMPSFAAYESLVADLIERAGVSPSTGEDRLREALEGMVNQFAYWGGDGITTGGLSALEDAFDVLGYSDPQPAPWRGCDEPGCREEGSSGWPSPDGYRRTCHEHSDFHQQRRCNWPSDSSHFAALTPTGDTPKEEG